jgi:hypothetical protein
MRAVGCLWLLAATLVLVRLGPPARGADIIDVTDWKTATDVFSNDPKYEASAISGMAEIDAEFGVRVYVSASCPRNGGVGIAVHIENAEFDVSGDGASVQIPERLDNYDAERTTGYASMQRTLEFETYGAQHLSAGNYLVIGLPIDGREEVFRIPLKHKPMARFLSECALVEAAAQAEEARKKASRDAAIEMLRSPLCRPEADLNACVVANFGAETYGNCEQLQERAAQVVGRDKCLQAARDLDLDKEPDQIHAYERVLGR